MLLAEHSQFLRYGRNTTHVLGILALAWVKIVFEVPEDPAFAIGLRECCECWPRGVAFSNLRYCNGCGEEKRKACDEDT